GIMDQSAAIRCRAGHALFLDCRDESVEQIPFDLDAAGLAVLVIDSRAPHRHADGEYAARRRSCEAAAKALGVPALRDVTVDQLDSALARLDDDETRRRVRHVVTEDQRVLDTVALLRAGRVQDIGPLLTASHVSMRDDFEITVPEIDTAVEAALEAGALGARMTGGGFGGCVLAL
ncbi:galactokinase, partial [Micromonospora sp. ALFpr18c]